MEAFIGIILIFAFCFFVIFGIVKPSTDLIKKRRNNTWDSKVKSRKSSWDYKARSQKNKRTLDEIIADEKTKKQNLEKQRLQSDYEKWLKDNPEYDPKNDPVAHDYLKDKRPKPLSTKEKLEREYIKKRNNPDLNLFLDHDFELHLKRLRLYGRSKWNGETYFMGQRGGIYTISANGTRNYKY